MPAYKTISLEFDTKKDWDDFVEDMNELHRNFEIRSDMTQRWTDEEWAEELIFRLLSRDAERGKSRKEKKNGNFVRPNPAERPVGRQSIPEVHTAPNPGAGAPGRGGN